MVFNAEGFFFPSIQNLDVSILDKMPFIWLAVIKFSISP